jgi:hypothetical protein
MRIQIRIDPHQFGKSDWNPGRNRVKNPDPDPYQSPNSGAMEAENRPKEGHPVAVTAHNRGREAHNGGLEDR